MEAWWHSQDQSKIKTQKCGWTNPGMRVWHQGLRLSGLLWMGLQSVTPLDFTLGAHGSSSFPCGGYAWCLQLPLRMPRVFGIFRILDSPLQLRFDLHSPRSSTEEIRTYAFTDFSYFRQLLNTPPRLLPYSFTSDQCKAPSLSLSGLVS